MQYIDVFLKLGVRFNEINNDSQVVADAIAENKWFSKESILSSIASINEKFLQREKIETWLSAYDFSHRASPRNVGVIMAGNIPLVGFFDLMCVVLSGNNCYVKTSSKDSVLMNYVINIIAELPIYKLDDSVKLDAVIATGSNNTNRYFEHHFRNIPRLLRKSRTSVVVLSGSENDEQLKLLAQDVFSFFGMGCRNVSRIFLPKGYDPEKIVDIFRLVNITHQNYINAYRHHKALLQMRGEIFFDGHFFTLRECYSDSEALSDILFSYYDNISAVEQWLTFSDIMVQCVVSDCLKHPRVVGFGESQSPELTDYPDGVDVMNFLQ